jgi:PhoH-like ATPase
MTTHPRSDVELSDPATTRVLDTSVLVSDAEAFSAFGLDQVVIPLVVIEELDHLKSRSDEVGWMARAALRALEELRMSRGGSLVDDPAAVPRVRVEINGVNRDRLVEAGLDPSRPDNRILGVAVTLSQHGPVQVVSNDTALRLKAAHLGLSAVEHAAVTEPMGRGWDTVEVDGGIVAGLYAGDTVPSAEPDNSFAVLRAGTSSVLVRARSGSWERLRNNGPEAWGLRPRNKEQRFALELLLDPEVPVVALHGPAGTGKSILAIAAGLEQVVEQGRYQRLSVFRSLVPVAGEEVGFLPGDLESKVSPYFAATFDSIAALTEHKSVRDAEKVVAQLMGAGQLTMEPVSFLRGRSLAGTFIVVDEATNLERAVLKTLLTRVGEGTKIVFTGDTSQIDNPFASASNNALTALVSAFGGQDCFGHLELTSGERSGVASLAARLL